jgi:hypothetical protein
VGSKQTPQAAAGASAQDILSIFNQEFQKSTDYVNQQKAKEAQAAVNLNAAGAQSPLVAAATAANKQVQPPAVGANFGPTGTQVAQAMPNQESQKSNSPGAKQLPQAAAGASAQDVLGSFKPPPQGNQTPPAPAGGQSFPRQVSSNPTVGKQLGK